MPSTHRITRAAHPESLNEFREFIKEHCANVPGVNHEVLYAVQLAVDEACTNIITHGYKDLTPGSIILDLELNPDKLTVCLTDFGHSFKPSDVPVPDIRAPLEERQVGGYGLFLIQRCMDEMNYQVTEDGNKMILSKHLGNTTG